MKFKIIILTLLLSMSACTNKTIIYELPKSTIAWPNCFITGEFNYTNDETGRAKAISDGITAWANISLTKYPEYFGYCIIKMSYLLDIEPDEEEFIKAANIILNK